MDIFISATLRDSGHVGIRREIDGVAWRRSIDPHDQTGLDRWAPEIPAPQKQAILDKWAIVPVPPPDPVEPPQTLRQQIISRLRADPVMRAQAIETRDRLGLNNAKLLDLYEQKAVTSI